MVPIKNNNEYITLHWNLHYQYVLLYYVGYCFVLLRVVWSLNMVQCSIIFNFRQNLSHKNYSDIVNNKRYTFVCCAVPLFPIAFSYTDVYKNGIVQQRIWYSELCCIHSHPGALDPSFSLFDLIKHMPPWRRNIVPRKYHVTIFKRGWDNYWFTYVRYELHLMII